MGCWVQDFKSFCFSFSSFGSKSLYSRTHEQLVLGGILSGVKNAGRGAVFATGTDFVPPHRLLLDWPADGRSTDPPDGDPLPVVLAVLAVVWTAGGKPV
jgi:hypothetical protein